MYIGIINGYKFNKLHYSTPWRSIQNALDFSERKMIINWQVQWRSGHFLVFACVCVCSLCAEKVFSTGLIDESARHLEFRKQFSLKLGGGGEGQRILVQMIIRDGILFISHVKSQLKLLAMIIGRMSNARDRDR